jgi:hypothetical protein
MVDVNYELWPKQMQAYTSDADMLLYGGAGGSGKSHLGRIEQATLCMEVPGAICYIVREHLGDIRKNHFIGPTSFPVLLGPMIEAGAVRVNARDCEIEFANGPIKRKPFDGGSKIIGAPCAHEGDLVKFHGPEITHVWFEESARIQQSFIEWIMSRTRVPDTLPVKGTRWEGRLPRALFTTNPVGISLDWHRKTFIDGKEPYKVYREVKSIVDDLGKAIEYVRRLQFIPAGLSDNPSIDKASYVASLAHLSPELQDAILRGLWNVRFGSFYPELSSAVHVLQEHWEPSEHLTRFGCHDWGSVAPCGTTLWAVIDSEHPVMPRGSLYCYREIYLADPRNTKNGIRCANREIARGIKEAMRGHNMTVWTDSIPFQDRGGIPMYTEYEMEGVHLLQADMSKKEVSASMVRGRLKGRDGRPDMYFSPHCPHTFRTLAALEHDPHNPEKPLGAEDHLPDTVMHAARMWSHVTDSAQSLQEQIRQQMQSAQQPIRHTVRTIMQAVELGSDI